MAAVGEDIFVYLGGDQFPKREHILTDPLEVGDLKTVDLALTFNL
jgi:hypothetical protein